MEPAAWEEEAEKAAEPRTLLCGRKVSKERLPVLETERQETCSLKKHTVNINIFASMARSMCNPRNYSDTPPTSKSTVEELHEPIPSLFRALTEGDTQLNWNIVSFPVAEELSHHENLVSFLETVNQPQHQNVSVPNNNVHTPYSSDKEHMCTVVYFDDCMSIHQCKISCESMGASKYRWFHNACCECIGPECIDYGSKTVKCMNCMF
ncbi:hypothetical protein DUI87_07771 [Hirundo rustica rustica]|uniref:Tsg C-terminal domain-containing protein n=1 Tax=Hirundo rustica rustica TaxID=333673 RepID=A0A3M0KSB5_HIRRU|nr:hypothetical protein DUI87_07771 [Hirundo rustica rustica]